jgi:hypothetical protein
VKILVLGGTSSVANDFLRIASTNKSWEIYATFCKNKPKTTLNAIRNLKFCLDSGTDDFKTTLSLCEINFSYILNFIVLDSNTDLISKYELLSSTIKKLVKSDTKFINISSNAVYEKSSHLKLENSALDVTNQYSIQKIMSEEILNHQQLNLRAAILPVNGFGSGSLVKNIYYAPKKSKIFVNPNNYWNGVLSTHFAKILCAVIDEELFTFGARNIFSLEPEPTLNLIDALKSFTDRQDLVVENSNSAQLNSTTLSTLFKDFHNNLWTLSNFGAEISTRQVLEDLSKLRFHHL